MHGESRHCAGYSEQSEIWRGGDGGEEQALSLEFTASGDKRSLTAMYGKNDARPDRTKYRTVSEDGNFAATARATPCPCDETLTRFHLDQVAT